MKIKSPLLAASAVFVIGLQSAQAVVVLADTFGYATGPIINATGSPWVTHSGNTSGQVDVSGGIVNLTSAESEDVNAPLTGNPYTTGILTASFTVNFSALPSTAGAYFAHFKDVGTGFRSRLVANTTGAASGRFRLGISNAGGSVATTTNVGTNLLLGTIYSVAMTWNFDTNSSTLSIDGGPAVTASDTVIFPNVLPITVTSFALRQNAGIGTLTMDNLSVDYIPEPSSAMLLGAMGILGVLRRRR